MKINTFDYLYYVHDDLLLLEMINVRVLKKLRTILVHYDFRIFFFVMRHNLFIRNAKDIFSYINIGGRINSSKFG